jgi:hypothetical protein
MRVGFGMVALLAACVDADSGGRDAGGTATVDRIGANGIELQGDRLSGIQMQGVLPNFVNMQGTTLDGIQLGGRALVGTQFQPAPLVNAPFTGMLSNGESVSLRIDAAGVLPNSGGIWAYSVAYQNQQGWAPLCGLDGSGAPIQAIPVPGIFDHTKGTVTGGSYTPSSTSFTFGCREAAIAKCIEFGYPAVAPGRQFAACTRMLRADYCGDGLSWTLNGTLINFYDNIGVAFDRASWPFEAEWSEQGARCVSATTTLRWVGASETPPPCLASKRSADCGDLSHFASGTLLMNEYNGR